jgi:hypothetical protein
VTLGRKRIARAPFAATLVHKERQINMAARAISFEVHADEARDFSSLRAEPTQIPPSPFSIGNSPLTIKGVAFRGVLAAYERVLPGALRRITEATRDANLAHYLGQDFIANASYDVFALVETTRTVSEILGVPAHVITFRLSENQAESDLAGVYKLLLRAFSPMQIIGKLVRVTDIYFNFAPASAREVRPGVAEFVRTGFPAVLLHWYMPVAEGYLRVALARTGAKNIRAEALAEPEAGTQHGLELATFRLKINWSI